MDWLNHICSGICFNNNEVITRNCRFGFNIEYRNNTNAINITTSFGMNLVF